MTSSASQSVVLGTLGTGTAIAATAKYSNAYITLPAGKWAVTVNLFMGGSASYWVRTYFSNSSTTSTITADKIGGGMIM